MFAVFHRLDRDIETAVFNHRGAVMDFSQYFSASHFRFICVESERANEWVSDSTDQFNVVLDYVILRTNNILIDAIVFKSSRHDMRHDVMRYNNIEEVMDVVQEKFRWKARIDLCIDKDWVQLVIDDECKVVNGMQKKRERN